MIYLRAALGAIEASSFLMKLVTGAGVIVMLTIAYGVWHHNVYQSGFNDALAKVAAADAKAIARATAYRKKLLDCKSTGRGWDQSTGRCLGE